jgi:hypothetical protein
MSKKSLAEMCRAVDFFSFFLRLLGGSWAPVRIPEAASSGTDKGERTFALSRGLMLCTQLDCRAQRRHGMWMAWFVRCRICIVWESVDRICLQDMLVLVEFQLQILA